MKTLTFLRHGKAEPAHKGQTDKERILAPRATEQLAIQAPRLQQAGFRPDLVLFSAATRTQETLGLLETTGLLAAAKVVMEERLYHASPERVLDIIAEQDNTAQSLLIIGHNPTVAHLAWHFSDEALRHALTKGFSTFSMASFALETSDWASLPAQAKPLFFFSPKYGSN